MCAKQAWESKDPKKEIEELKQQKQKHLREITAQSARSRYLINLNEEESSSEDKKAQREFDNCLICSTPFDRGIITYWYVQSKANGIKYTGVN
jgi:hypothetical protein